jgi:hypothetical protein
MSSHYLTSASALAGAKRMTSHYMASAISIHSRLDLILVENESLIFGYDKFGFVLSAFPIPEHNPYRPRIPEQLISHGEDFYDFFEENQQILREQHNITQVGDTTFPFQLMINAHDNQLYKLGAVGRFYHEDYGVILARYVQFSEFVTGTSAHSPVGLFKKKDVLEWVVTNDFSLSHPDLVIGVAAPFAVPREGQFGWVIVDGPNLQQVQNTSTTAALGESFAWSATGAISNSAEGKVIGRRVNRLAGTSRALLEAQLWVRTESFSEAQITSLVNSTIQDLRDALDQLESDLAALPSASALSTLQASINAIKTQLTLETNQRRAQDELIQTQLNGLNFVTITTLNNAVTNVTNLITATASGLQTQIDEIRLIALDALNKANQALSVDIDEINNQLMLILLQLSEEIARPKGRFPVVDGAVPPNLVYLGDGSLVYVETF